MIRVLIAFALAVLLFSAAFAAEPDRAQRQVLERAQAALAAGDAEAALAALDAWPGALLAPSWLLRGHAEIQAQRPVPAEAAFRSALALDPSLRPAGLGLLRALADQGRHADVIAEAGPWLGLGDATAEETQFFINTALLAGDASLAVELGRQGLPRFPNDAVIRRLLAAGLAEIGRGDEAWAVLLPAVDRAPGDAVVWRALAAAAQAAGDAARLRSALAAALLADPNDAATIEALARHELIAGMPLAALSRLRPLAEAADCPPARLALALRAAEQAGAISEGRAWFARLPEAERETRDLRLLAARLALADGDRSAARALIAPLATAGDVNAGLWAARLAEEDGDIDHAEALLRQTEAIQADGSDEQRLLGLHLMRLLITRDRPTEAVAIGQRLLRQHPGDQAASRLLAIAEARAQVE